MRVEGKPELLTTFKGDDYIMLYSFFHMVCMLHMLLMRTR